MRTTLKLDWPLERGLYGVFRNVTPLFSIFVSCLPAPVTSRAGAEAS